MSMSLIKSFKVCSLKYFSTLMHASLVIEHSENFNNVTNTKRNNKDSKTETILYFKQMRCCSSNKPLELTYAAMFKACALLYSLEEGRQVHVDCLKRGLDSDVYVCNTMIHFYGSCKKIINARKVFDEMTHTSVVSWNTIISAFLKVSWFYESLEYYMRMRVNGIEPNETTKVVVLSVCAELGNLTIGKCVHTRIIVNGLKLTCQLGTALVNMYAKCGDLSRASLVFETMRVRNVWTWSAMIHGLAQHGLARRALLLFKKMKDDLVEPNDVTFIGVLFACSHAGLVEDGCRFFDEMKHVYGIKPRLTHYGAMVDVLGRSGRLNEAYNFIMNMEIKPDPTVWRTLLSACSVHNDIDFDGVGEKVQKRLLDLEPRWSGNLVIIANKYADVCKWNDAAQLRKMMKVTGLKKMAAESCIEVKGSNFRFLSGYDSQASSVNIYLLIDGLSLNMKSSNICYI